MKRKVRYNFFICFDYIFFFSDNINYYKTKKDDNKNFSILMNFIKIYINFFAYLIHPNSLILGVWHSSSLSSSPNNHLASNYWHLPLLLGRSIVSFCLCLFFLLVSSCFIDSYLIGHVFGWLFPILDQYCWLPLSDFIQLILHSYSTAVQFHFSHYFICFAAQSMFDLWNIP